MIAKLRSHANVPLFIFVTCIDWRKLGYHHHYCNYVSNEVTFGLFREIFMKINMNIIALEITSNTVLLTAVIQSAHLIGARGSSPGGIGQGRVAENLV